MGGLRKTGREAEGGGGERGKRKRKEKDWADGGELKGEWPEVGPANVGVAHGIHGRHGMVRMGCPRTTRRDAKGEGGRKRKKKEKDRSAE